MLYGPMETATKPTLTIYVDKTSKDYDIRRRSRMVEHELKMPIDNPWLQRERIYIYGNYNFRVVDVLDLPSFPKAREFPCVRITKNNECMYFPENTFAANGTFTLTMYDIIIWIKFLDKIEEYSVNHHGDNGLISLIDKIERKLPQASVFSIEKPMDVFMWHFKRNAELLPYPNVPRKEFEK